MWPRGSDAQGGAGGGITALRTSRSSGLFGFVSFMSREDAELAFSEGATTNWGGCALSTSWGKAMPPPPMPRFYASAERRDRGRGSLGREDEEGRERDMGQGRRKRKLSPGGSERPHRRQRRSRSPSPRSLLVRQVESSDPETAQLIRSIAERVRSYGPSFEKLVKEREASNPSFAWLRGRTDNDDDDHRATESDIRAQREYYHLLLDPRHEVSLPPKDFSDSGPTDLYSSDSGEDSERERFKSLSAKRRKMAPVSSTTTIAGTTPLSSSSALSIDTTLLGLQARKRFEAMLRSLTLRRERIARAMCFAITHAHAAEVVVRILLRSLLIPTTPLPRKLARLYVLSDILHNSAGGGGGGGGAGASSGEGAALPPNNVWRYRHCLEGDAIVGVFQHMGDVARSFPGIMKQEALRGQLRGVVDVWEGWLVFAPQTLEGCRAGIERGSAGAVGGAKGRGVDVDVEEGKAVPEPSSRDVRVTVAAGFGEDDDEDEDEDIDGEAL